MKNTFEEYVSWLLARNWKIPFEAASSHKMLDENIEKLLKEFPRIFTSKKYLFTFVIMWNTAIDTWSRNIQFLVSNNKEVQKKILRYMWLEEIRGIPGILNIIYDLNSSPRFELVFTTFSSDNKNSIIKMKVDKNKEFPSITISLNTAVFSKLKAQQLFQFNDSDLYINWICYSLEDSLIKISNYKSDGKEISWNKQIAKFINQYEDIQVDLNELINCISTINEKSNNQISKEIKVDKVDIMATLFNVYRILVYSNGGRYKLKYFFNTSGAVSSSASSQERIQRDGGALIILDEEKQGQTILENIKEDNYLSIIAGIIFPKSAAAQRVFLKYMADIHSLKYAVTSIIGRNMSHNIGSHVVNYLIQNLNEVLKCLYRTGLNNTEINNIKNQIINSELDLKKNNPINISLEKLKNKGIINKKLLGIHKFFQDLKYFLSYLKNRMEFIANYSTLDVAWTDDYKLSDIIKFWNDNKILKDYIAKSEKLSEKKIAVLPDDTLNNKIVSIPDGEIGLHSVYMIIENFIRNSAKHGLKKDNGTDELKLEFSINDCSIEDYNSELYKIELWDNLENFEDAFKNIISKKELIKFLEIEKEKNYKEIDFLNKNNSKESFFAEFNDLSNYNDVEIKKDFIDEQGRLLKSNWGIKEIFIGAAYLRMLDTSKIIDDNDPPILSIGYKKDNEKKHLKYTFYMLKPKNLLIVYKKDTISKDFGKLLKNDNNEKLKEKGIDFYEIVELKDKIENGEKLRHKFMLLYSDILNKELKGNYTNSEQEEVSYLSRLPYRIIENEEKDSIIKILNSIEKKKYYEVLSILFYSIFIKKEKYKKTRFIISLKKEHKIDQKIIKNLENVFIVEKQKNNNECYFEFNKNNNYENIIKFQEHAEWKNINDNNKFYFNLTGNNSLKHKFFSYLADINYYKIFLYNIYEAFLYSILIIDERIFEKYKDDRGNKNRFRNQNIDIFDYDEEGREIISINNISKEESKKDKDIFQDAFNNKEYQFIIIHQGIIDKLIKIEQGDTKERKIDKVIENLKSYGEKIIVCSGRGKPEYLNPEVRFLSLGNLINWLDDNKYTLVKGLLSVRR